MPQISSILIDFTEHHVVPGTIFFNVFSDLETFITLEPEEILQTIKAIF